MRKEKKKLAKISFSARGFARSLPDSATCVLRKQRSLMCGFASFFASSFLTATAECLCYSPKGQNRERKSPFHIRTADMLSTWDNSPNYEWRVRCWVVEARPKKGNCVHCTLSGHDCWGAGPKPDEWEYSWHLIPRRTSPSSSSASLVRAFPSVAVPFATCVSRKCWDCGATRWM